MNTNTPKTYNDTKYNILRAMKKFKQFLIISFFILMILFPEISITGTKKGLVLWYEFVLPALFPFIICCSLLIHAGAIPVLSYPFHVILSPLFKLSQNGCFVLLSGLFCGYPIGAKNCCDLYLGHKISKKEAMYLLSISNHPSPMFIIGYLTGLLPDKAYTTPFVMSIYLSLLPIMVLSRKFYNIAKNNEKYIAPEHNQTYDFNESIIKSFDTIVCIGIYMMIFSIISCFLIKIISPKNIFFYIVLAMCEMTTGAKNVSEGYANGIISSNICSCILLVSVITGAVSGIVQTNSVIKNAGLSIRHYIVWKFLQSIISCIIFILLQQLPDWLSEFHLLCSYQIIRCG